LRPNGAKFEVLDVDGDSIELQDEDGMLDKIDADEWPELDLELASQTEDSTAAFDNVPLPDDADGGDPADVVVSNIDLQRVSNEERIETSKDIDDTDDYSAPPTSE